MTTFRPQIAIIGGGVCGLWLLARLRDAGFEALLVERDSLGGQQTLASQGMIHGGIKYTLGGFTTAASETIAGMPARWRECLAGGASPDLRGVTILSEHYYLFSDRRLTSKIAAFFGSKALRGRIEPVPPREFPEPFCHSSFDGTLYRLADIVVDTESLVRKLAGETRAHILHADGSLVLDDRGEITGLDLGRGFCLEAGLYIFAAGAGNEALLADSAAAVRMQRRPLKQVMVKQPGLPAVFAHAIKASAGAKPRITITSHRASDGDMVWYLGGELAESGVGRTDAAQQVAAQREMRALFPWIEWEGARWATLPVDRAEPARADHTRPDTPFARRIGNAIVCWPTKLTLVPMLADEVLQMAQSAAPAGEGGVPPLAAPPFGKPPWETAFA